MPVPLFIVSTCEGHIGQTLSELAECDYEFVIVKSLSMRHRSFTASEKLKITEEEETEIGLLKKIDVCKSCIRD
jgi:hypothetical protein